MLDLLARRRVKGRGAIGSRADEPGPFLPSGAEGGPAAPVPTGCMLLPTLLLLCSSC